MFTGIGIALLGITLIILSRSITTFFHEMGHAIPALLFTDKDVIVCIGSYGDISSSTGLRIGRLNIFFKLNFLEWILGVCAHSKAHSTLQEVIIVLGGPLASLVIGIFTFIHLQNGHYSDGYMTIAYAFILSAIWDFFVNIIPSNKPLNLYNGETIYNDGTQLVRILNKNRLPEHFFIAEKSYREGAYENAKQILKQHHVIKNDDYINLLLDTHIALEEYENAIDIFHEYKKDTKLNARDKARLGEIFFLTKEYEKSLEYYNDALYYEFTNALFLLKRGIIKEKLSDIEGAIKDYYAALNYNGGLAEAYARLASIFMLKEEYSESLNLLNAAIKIDENNSLAHFLLGKYHMKKDAEELALKHFLKAEALGSTEHGLEFHIANLQADIEIKNLSHD